MTIQNSGVGIAPRCQFHFSDGRSCRMSCSPAHPVFCAFHARQELQLLESQRLGTEISATFHGNFLSATDINHVLGKLFTAVAQDRIPLRKAAILTYLGQVMLSSLPYVKKEYQFEYKFDHWRTVVSEAAPLSIPLPSPIWIPLPNPSPNSPNPTPGKSNSRRCKVGAARLRVPGGLPHFNFRMARQPGGE